MSDWWVAGVSDACSRAPVPSFFAADCRPVLSLAMTFFFPFPCPSSPLFAPSLCFLASLSPLSHEGAFSLSLAVVLRRRPVILPVSFCWFLQAPRPFLLRPCPCPWPLSLSPPFRCFLSIPFLLRGLPISPYRVVLEHSAELYC